MGTIVWSLKLEAIFTFVDICVWTERDPACSTRDECTAVL